MKARKLQSQFVARIMAGATPDEIEDATERWFAFLETVSRIAIKRERSRHDSLESLEGDNFEGIPPPV